MYTIRNGILNDMLETLKVSWSELFFLGWRPIWLSIVIADFFFGHSLFSSECRVGSLPFCLPSPCSLDLFGTRQPICLLFDSLLLVSGQSIHFWIRHVFVWKSKSGFDQLFDLVSSQTSVFTWVKCTSSCMCVLKISNSICTQPGWWDVSLFHSTPTLNVVFDPNHLEK